MNQRSLLLLGALLAACDNNPGTPDSGRPDTGAMEDAPMVTGNDCATYCTQITTNCTGDNAQYVDMADCMSYCAAAAWPPGDPGAAGGNSLACRIYHGGAPAAGDPAMHCAHAGASGAGVCGPPVTFRTDMPPMYTRVDRMGMPAVATALIGSAMKNAYNDANPSDDEMGDFVTELAMRNTALHMALDDDLVAPPRLLTPCSMTIIPPGESLPECFSQDVIPGVPVAALVVPDTLNLDPALPAGFPNGRRLEDPVIDVTLSVILLRLGATCGTGTCGPTTLVGVNPMMNDVANLTTFPYLAPAHQPMP
jgi:hypothetical protein